MAATEAPSQPETDWDEAQCAAALAHLERLQEQIDDLRLAIPRVIEPFHRPANATTFKLYAQGVVNSQKSVQSIHQAWKNPEAQTIFEHTKKSFAANGDLEASRSIPDYGWIEREQRERKAKSGGRNEVLETNVGLTDEDVNRVCEEFKKSYEGVKLEVQDERRLILINLISGALRLNFRVSIEREANGKPKLNAECVGANEPFLAITRCIASRPQASDLKYLLDMIAAYKTNKGSSCSKCGKLLDNAALVPTARRQKQTVGADGTTETSWDALHESCLE